MTASPPRGDFPDPIERAALNAELFATGAETGFWDDGGRPAPWPDDWTPDGWAAGTSQRDQLHPELEGEALFRALEGF
ncbi:MAG: hypothetical protein QOE51_4551 [Actinoplanes sp.]|jgi:hypothetical protein|nr:hypothetical protein [Actinoplanes sp.]